MGGPPQGCLKVLFWWENRFKDIESRRLSACFLYWSLLIISHGFQCQLNIRNSGTELCFLSKWEHIPTLQTLPYMYLFFSECLYGTYMLLHPFLKMLYWFTCEYAILSSYLWSIQELLTNMKLYLFFEVVHSSYTDMTGVTNHEKSGLDILSYQNSYPSGASFIMLTH